MLSSWSPGHVSHVGEVQVKYRHGVPLQPHVDVEYRCHRMFEHQCTCTSGLTAPLASWSTDGDEDVTHAFDAARTYKVAQNTLIDVWNFEHSIASRGVNA